jgi:hypothetical protein
MTFFSFSLVANLVLFVVATGLLRIFQHLSIGSESQIHKAFDFRHFSGCDTDAALRTLDMVVGYIRGFFFITFEAGLGASLPLQATGLLFCIILNSALRTSTPMRDTPLDRVLSAPSFFRFALRRK